MVESVCDWKAGSGLDELEKCGSCGGRLIKDIERGQYVCVECGTVMNCPLLSSECDLDFARSASLGDYCITGINESGPPTTLALHDLGISTEIGRGFRDASGKPLHGKSRYRAFILRKWHSRMRTKDENDLSVAKALSALNDLADRLELPEYVREEASAIYRRVSDRRLTMGRSKVALVAVCVYAAIRRAKLPLMLRDVLPVMDMGMAEFNLYMNVIKREARIEVPPPAPAAWIPKIASECHFSPSTQLLAANYLHLMVKEGETFGMLPHVVAAIALCRMGALNGERKNVYQVARAVKCAPASILKGFVSDSAALRNCGRSRFSESESRRLDGRIAGGDIPRSCSERIGGYYSRMSYVSNIDSRVRT